MVSPSRPARRRKRGREPPPNTPPPAAGPLLSFGRYLAQTRSPPMTVATIPSTTLYPARKGEHPLTAEDIWAVPRVGSPVPSPDGSRLAVTVTRYDLEKNAGRGRIWLVPLPAGHQKAGEP